MLLRALPALIILALTASCTVKPAESDVSRAAFGENAHQCLSEALYHEARGTSEAGLRAVAEVILNRMENPQFPDTVCGVIDQRYNNSCQFSYRCDAIPNDVYSEPVELIRIQSIAQAQLDGEFEIITNGALFFHAASMVPGWFGTLSPRGKFGGNIFYQ